MNPSENSRPVSPNTDAQSAVAERLRERRLRVRMIRRRVAGVATATFLATSAGVFIQLVTGNDPALAKKATNATSSGSGASAASASSASSQASSSSLTPVTTRAS